MTEATTSADAGNVADANATAEAAAATAAQTTTSQASWRDSLPDDIKSAPSLSKFETIEGLAKSYTNLEKMLGADKVVVPKDGDEEGAQRFFKAAGWPDKPEEYGFKAPEKVPDGMVYNPELDTKIAGLFHGAKLTKAQAAAVREGLMEVVASGASESMEASKAAQAANEAALMQAEQSLKQEWGPAYDTRAKVAGAAINKFAPPEAIAVMEANGLANNPAIVRMFYDIGTKLSGEKELIGSDEQSMTLSDLDSSIADFREKHGAALLDRSHADHKVRVAEYTKLFERRYPNHPA